MDNEAFFAMQYLMKDILDKLRSRDANKEALLIYEDQPTNDFKPLFLMTQVWQICSLLF